MSMATRNGPMPRPTSSSTVCSASARPRISGSFTFSSTALHRGKPQARLACSRGCPSTSCQVVVGSQVTGG